MDARAVAIALVDRVDPCALVLFGVSGSGKSTVGAGLAPTLGATFLEGDSFHPAGNIAKMRAGTPLDDADRWPWLETLGHAIGEQSCAGRPVVAACSALRRSYRDALCRAARRPLTFIHLTIDPALLETRLRARPLHFMPASLLRSQLDALEPLQADEDGTEIFETGSPQQTADAVRAWLARTGHAFASSTEHAKGRPSRPSHDED